MIDHSKLILIDYVFCAVGGWLGGTAFYNRCKDRPFVEEAVLCAILMGTGLYFNVLIG